MSLAVPDRFVVVVARSRHRTMTAELAAAAGQGIPFVEVRLDYLSRAADFKRLAEAKGGAAWMATVRRQDDGGRWVRSEADRLVLVRQAIASGLFEWVDLETDIADGVRRFGAVKRVVSYHNTRETPEDLDDIYARMADQDADVLKLAVAADGPADCARVLALQKAARKPTVAFCMGEYGFPTRLLGLKLGAPWMYAGFNPDRGLAAGLPNYHHLRATYPVDRLGPATRVFGLLADPVAHSHSPAVHNAAYRRLGADAVYLPFRVPADQFAAAVGGFAGVPVDGYSVTIPHKEAAARLAAAGADPLVARVGAANTLVRSPAGGFAAYNTDAEAAVEALRAHFAARPAGDPAPPLGRQAVLLLGAGGVARAVAFALAREGAKLTIAGRTLDRAERLAAEVGGRAVDWHHRYDVAGAQLVVNGTPVGMHPDVDEAPVHGAFLKPGMTVFDTVYNPEQTKLIRDARSRGCHVVLGTDMFVRQAARQVGLFLGLQPDLEAMRADLRRAMSPVALGPDPDADDDGQGEE